MADTELLEVAFFLSKYGKNNPPELLNVKNWNEAYDLFNYQLNENKTNEEFRNSLKNLRDHFDSHLDNSRVGWMKNGEPEKLSSEAKEIFEKLDKLSEKDIFELNKKYMPLTFDKSKKKDLYWSFDINTFRLIGSQLISDKFTAIIELVKNCYDANSTDVKLDFINPSTLENARIILKDNGHGMNSNQIENSWMRIGTNFKREKEKSEAPFNRVFLGEKGIGRFAIEKLANKVVLKSRELNNRINILEIDWNVYNDISLKNLNTENFTSIPNTFYSIDESNENYKRINDEIGDHGTILEFSNLKDIWTIYDIKRIKQELSKFVSPIEKEFNKNEFNIFIRTRKSDQFESTIEYEKVLNDSLKYASFHVKINFDKNKNKQEELYFNNDTGEIEIKESDIYDFGPVKLEIYYYDQYAKKRFSAAYKGEDVKLDGFKIYRDNIITTPFIEKADVLLSDEKRGIPRNRDILGLDVRRYSGFFDKISSRDYIGFIEITKENNPNIKDLTNRQDFENTPQFKKFKDFIIKQIEAIELKLNYKKEQDRVEDTKKFVDSVNIANNILSSLKKLDTKEHDTNPIKNEVKELVKNIKLGKNEIENLKQDLEKEKEIFTRLISLQEFAATLSHTVRNSVEILIDYSEALLKETAVDTLAYEIAVEIDNEVNMLVDLVNYMLDYANSGKNIKKFDISKFIIDTFNAYNKTFEKYDIKSDISNINNTLMINHNKILIKEIFDNLISNSIRSLNKLNDRKKIIKCTTLLEKEKFIIIFSDNGVGIAPEIKHKIYDLRFTTNSESGGAGIGLYKIKTTLKTLHGNIELIEPEFEQGCTFKITIPLD